MNATAKRPKTKAAKNVEDREWVTFGGMSYQVSHAWEEDGKVFMMFGNFSVSEFRPDERVTMHYDD